MSVLSAKPGAENGPGPAAAALRHILATGIAGESFPSKHSWVIVTTTANSVMFGRRVGKVGISDTVTVQRRGSRYAFSGSGGCGPLGYPGHRTAASLDSYRATSQTLVLQWVGGLCMAKSPVITKVTETPTAVQVLLIPPPQLPGFCASAGIPENTELQLAAPLGSRRVLNAGYLPTIPVDDVRGTPSGKPVR